MPKKITVKSQSTSIFSSGETSDREPYSEGVGDGAVVHNESESDLIPYDVATVVAAFIPECVISPFVYFSREDIMTLQANTVPSTNNNNSELNRLFSIIQSIDVENNEHRTTRLSVSQFHLLEDFLRREWRPDLVEKLSSRFKERNPFTDFSELLKTSEDTLNQLNAVIHLPSAAPTTKTFFNVAERTVNELREQKQAACCDAARNCTCAVMQFPCNVLWILLSVGSVGIIPEMVGCCYTVLSGCFIRYAIPYDYEIEDDNFFTVAPCCTVERYTQLCFFPCEQNVYHHGRRGSGSDNCIRSCCTPVAHTLWDCQQYNAATQEIKHVKRILNDREPPQASTMS